MKNLAKPLPATKIAKNQPGSPLNMKPNGRSQIKHRTDARNAHHEQHMKRYLSVLILAAIVALFTGCAGGGGSPLIYTNVKKTGILTPPSGLGLVVLYHDAGGGAPLDVYESGTSLVNIPVRSFYTAFRNPGPVNLSLNINYAGSYAKGAVAGAIVGGLVAGPVGLVVGAAVGAPGSSMENAKGLPTHPPPAKDMLTVNVSPGQAYFVCVQPMRWSKHIQLIPTKQAEKELRGSTWLNPIQH